MTMRDFILGAAAGAVLTSVWYVAGMLGGAW